VRNVLLAATMLGALLVAGAPRAATEGDASDDCASIDPSMQARLRADLLRAYKPSCEGCTLDVVFDDCAPRAEISSLVYERGFGHSWDTTLTVTKLDRDGRGAWNVTRLELVSGKGAGASWGGERTDGVRVRRGVVSGTAIDDAVERAQAVTTAHLQEKSANEGSGGMWLSSGDFHDALAFDAGAKRASFEHTGYPTSTDQPEYLALDVAVQALDGAIPKAALLDAPFDAAARALFVERFLADAAIFDDEFHEWVREDWVQAAGDGGDDRLVPTLAKYLAAVPNPNDSSLVRTRVEAINALAALTHDDRRFDAAGVPRSIDAVALDYLGKPPK